MKNMFINYDNPIQQPEETSNSCNQPTILSTSNKIASLLKNVKDEIIGIQVKYASNFNLEVQLNNCDKQYLENSKVKFELYNLNNKSVFKKEFETATILNTEINKLILSFSEKESITLNRESYKMSIKLYNEMSSIEVFTPTDGFLVVR